MARLFRARIQSDYFRFLIGRNKRFIILMSAVLLVVYPIFVMTILSLNNFNAASELFLTGRVLAILFFVFFSGLVPLLMFSYLNTKKDLDVYFALPIKREQMLRTTGIAGYFILLIPFAIAWLSGGVLGMLYANVEPFVLVETFLTATMIGSAIYMVVVFTMMNTGTTFDAFLYSGAVHMVPFLVYGAYILFGYSMLLGFSDVNSYRILNFISPIWAIFNTIFAPGDLMFPPLAYGLYWVLISLVLSTVSSYLYATRRSERAESPFVNKRFFPIISTMYAVLTLILLYNFIYNTNSSTSLFTLANLIFPLLFAGILYLVMDTIANRGTKNMLKAVMRYTLVAAITLVIFIPSTLTGGFGYVTRLPNEEKVASVELSINGSTSLFLPTNNLSYSYNNVQNYPASVSRLLAKMTNPKLVFEDPDDIAAIIDFHKVVLAEYKWFDYSTKAYPARTYIEDLYAGIDGYEPSYEPFPFDNLDYGTTNLAFTYKMQDGSKMRRSYEVSAQWTRGLTELIDSTTMANLSAPLIVNRNEFDTISNFVLHDGLMTVSKPILSGFDFEVFSQKYLADLEVIAAFGSIAPDSTLLGYLEATGEFKVSAGSSVTVTDRIALDSRFTQTLAYLNSNNTPIPEAIYTENTAILVLPKPDTKNIIFYLASANSAIYSYTEAESKVTYVKLSAEQLAKIAPYLTATGLSDTALPTVFAVNNVVKGDVTYSEGASSLALRNLLVMPEHVEKVLEIVQDNPRETGIGFNFFNRELMLSGTFEDPSGQARYVFDGNTATKYYKGEIYDTCEYYVDASGNHIIVEYRGSVDPDVKPVAVESALWNVDVKGESFTHNFLGVSSSLAFDFKKVSD